MDFKMNNGIKWEVAQEKSDGNVTLQVIGSDGSVSRKETLSPAAFTTMWMKFMNWIEDDDSGDEDKFLKGCLVGEVKKEIF